VHNIRKSLDKLIHEESSQAEEVLDQLTALGQLFLPAHTIKELKLGNLLNNVKNKYKTTMPGVSEKATSIMVEWKKIMAEASVAGKHKSPKDGGKAHEHQHKHVEVAEFHTSSSVSAACSIFSSSSIAALPPARKSMFTIFVTSFEPACKTTEEAHSVALRVEDALNSHISSQTRLKEYTNKAKSLMFNLKKNTTLRDHVIGNTITPQQLVTLSTSDLASHEQKVARERIQAEQLEGRRSDWLEEHKEQIQLSIGLNPDNTWDYDEKDDEAMSQPDNDAPDI